MATDLKDYIRCYDGIVPATFCQSIMDTFDKSPHTEYLDRECRPTFTELNISQRYGAKDPAWVGIQNKLTNYFIDAVELYMRDLDVEIDFPAEYAFEENRVKMYQANNHDQFKDHVDVGNYNSARRFLVCFLYLNDVTLGGETNFPKLRHSITPERGRILVFPANWQYRHSGQPPLSGPKYIVGSYLHYL